MNYDPSQPPPLPPEKKMFVNSMLYHSLKFVHEILNYSAIEIERELRNLKNIETEWRNQINNKTTNRYKANMYLNTPVIEYSGIYLQFYPVFNQVRDHRKFKSNLIVKCYNLSDVNEVINRHKRSEYFVLLFSMSLRQSINL